VRILLACPYAWDAPGGVQVHVRQLAENLRERGHEVLVIAPGGQRADQPWVRIVGKPIRMRYQGTFAPICFSPASWRRIGRILTRFQADVVHAHEPTSPSTGMFAALRSQAPVVATFHANVERSRLLTAALPLLRPVWRRLRMKIAVSRAARDFYGSRFGDGIRVVPNGVDVELFSDAAPAPRLPAGRRILWTHRLDPQKGFRVAVEAFAELAGEFPDLSFVVIGEGRDRSAIQALPAEARSRVFMLGTVPHDRLPPYHAGADVFVAPALGQESFGIVLVEAMAAGVPVVATDIGGYREVIRKDVDGLMVPPGDPMALAQAVARILREPELGKKLSEAGRARAREFTWDRVVGEVEDVYGDALRSGTRGLPGGP
jgi:phosphatidyl-myo-inositol alpha-mannosyltransferase